MQNNSNETGHLSVARHPIIVQSHLRWDFVWQRPQQLMSRFALNAPILFIEEAIYLDDISSDRIEVTIPAHNVFRALPFLRGSLRDDYDKSAGIIRDLVVREMEKSEALKGVFVNAVQWFYTPMPAPAMLGAFNEICVVYDCMDELAQFRHAPRDIGRRERLLLSNTDVVFTGGYQLFLAKAASHSNVYFFGCGVDAAHYAKARSSDTIVPQDGRFDSPVAGYFGVIDERLDYDLIRDLAAQNPDLEVVMVGPTAKVSPDELPQAKNIHWLGQRSYDELPAYVKGFDVCLMPFAMNEATEFINPTKTLEYMAAGKPVVSTAVADVMRNFGSIVSVAKTRDEFIARVARDAAAPDTELLKRGIQMASRASWENIIQEMSELIHGAAQVTPLVIAEQSTDALSL